MILALLLATAAAVAPAPPVIVLPPPPATTPAPAAPVYQTVDVRLETAKGPIVLRLEKERAPITTANFLKYVDGKRLDGTAFYRVVRVTPTFGFIQFGTQNDAKRTLPPIAHEATTQTGLSHTDGAISMAMAAPGTAAGDFFIIVGDTPSMDASADQPGYAVFGHVEEGMETVRAIMALPTSPTKGEGVMKGSILEPSLPVTIVRRVP